MESMIKKEILQIATAPDGLIAIYEHEESESNKTLAVPVVAFALVEATENEETYRYTESMILDVETGSLEFASFSQNFAGVYYQ